MTLVTRSWTSYFGGSAVDGVRACAVESTNGFLYLVGDSASSDFPYRNAFRNPNPGSSVNYVASFDTRGIIIVLEVMQRAIALFKYCRFYSQFYLFYSLCW